MQRRHCGWWDQPFPHSAAYACGTRGFPQRRAACRKAPIRYPRATGTAPPRRRDFSSSSITLASVGGIVVTLPATTAATHQRSICLERTAAFPICWRPWPWARRPTLATALARQEITAGLNAPPAGNAVLSQCPVCSFPGIRFISGCRIALILPGAGQLPSVSCPVSIAISGQNGIYVVADKTYWIPLDEGGGGCSSYGAVPTAFSLPNFFGGRWFGRKGSSRAAGERSPLTAGSITSPRQTPAFPAVFDGNTPERCRGLVRESGKRRGYPVRGLGFHVLCLGITGRRQTACTRRTGAGRSMRLSSVRGPGFRGWSAKADSECLPCLLIRRPVAGHACSGRGTPTTTTRDRARNHSGLNGGYWPWASLYLV